MNVTRVILIIALVIAAYYVGSLRSELRLRTAAVHMSSTQPSTAVVSPTQPPGPVPPLAATDHIRGAKDASVVLVEYGDLECPFCKQFQPTMQQAMTQYGSRIAWVYRQFPLSFHANAEKEAEAAECANELGGPDAFWRYIDAVYQRTTSNGTGFALDQLAPLASELGMPAQPFQACIDSGKYQQHVQSDLTAGTTAGVNGTPTTFVLAKGKLVSSIPGAVSYSQLKQRIDAALQ